MTQGIFWSLIDSGIHLDYETRESKLVEALADLSESEIRDFELEFRRMILEANDYRILATAKIIDGYVSDDTFLYFRCWLIGKGKEVFLKVLEDPDALEAYVEIDEVPDFEGLLYVARTAAERKTGNKELGDLMDDSFDANLNYDRAPDLLDTDWTEDELPSLYPKLWAKFNP